MNSVLLLRCSLQSHDLQAIIALPLTTYVHIDAHHIERLAVTGIVVTLTVDMAICVLIEQGILG